MNKKHYFVTEYMPAVQFLDPPPVFKTKDEAMKYARDSRNAEMLAGYRKEQDTYVSGTQIAQFRCVHPLHGVQYAATVRDSSRSGV